MTCETVRKVQLQPRRLGTSVLHQIFISANFAAQLKQPRDPILNDLYKMSEKKRKRMSEKGDRPAKKVALHASETVKVQLLEDDDVLGPVIGM
jgi:hypothetical protein